MKKYFLLFLACLQGIVYSLGVCAQSDNTITIGTIDSIHSNILNEQRKVWVHVPNSGPNTMFAKQQYPVVYLMDGDAHFFSVVGMIQQLSSVNGNTMCPEMIVVGILNTDRSRDLTPSYSDEGGLDTNTGGGENFISFLENELMPHIDSVYPTEPYRMLIGHSLGGLMAIQALIHHTSLFNAYIAIDPSMWWDYQKLLVETQTALRERKFNGRSLYLGIANTLDEGMDIKKVKKDTTLNTLHIRSILELSKSLDSNAKNGLQYRYKYYPDDTHTSLPLIAEYDALRFIFNYYPLQLSSKEYSDTTLAVAIKLEKHYETISSRMGYKVRPPESLINSYGYQALQFGHYTQSAYFFKMNVANYPESYNVYDSLGDYYSAVGDTASAIEQFKKALALKENPESRKKLEALLGK